MRALFSHLAAPRPRSTKLSRVPCVSAGRVDRSLVSSRSASQPLIRAISSWALRALATAAAQPDAENAPRPLARRASAAGS